MYYHNWQYLFIFFLVGEQEGIFVQYNKAYKILCPIKVFTCFVLSIVSNKLVINIFPIKLIGNPIIHPLALLNNKTRHDYMHPKLFPFAQNFRIIFYRIKTYWYYFFFMNSCIIHFLFHFSILKYCCFIHRTTNHLLFVWKWIKS